MKHLEMEMEEEEDYDVYGEEDEDEIGLLHRRPVTSLPLNSHERNSGKRTIPRTKRCAVNVVLVLLALLAVHWNNQRIQPDGVTEKEQHSTTCHEEYQDPVILQSKNSSTAQVLQFACPCQVSVEDHDVHYHNTNSQKILEHVASYLQVFRDLDFDDWGRSFTEVKKGMYDWKSKYFAENLEDNSTIYDSACGIGMNLFMTLEILEEKGLKNLVVYGNDYVTESVQVANEIARRGALPAGGQLGTICPSDSINLRHVPSDSFDLVYTGYIAPLVDPLGLGKNGSSVFDLLKEYTAFCEQLNDPDSVQKKREAQHRQNQWFAHWFGEMIRIAKPGAPVIAEQVSYP
jgi:SAM-dependent methyltransferase